MNRLFRNLLVQGIFLMLFVTFSTVYADENAADSADDDLGIATGRVVFRDNKPVSRGFVFFFSAKDFEPMDFGTTRRRPATLAVIKEDGQFETQMFPAGSYFLGVLDRPKWRGGPPLQSEKKYSAIDANGEYRLFTIKEAESTDVGTVMVVDPGEKPEIAEHFTIMGRLIDENDQPIIGSVVTAKPKYGDIRASHISDPSTFGGYFRLVLPPGKYYLIARETVANSNRPKPDSLMGELGADKPIGIGGKPKQEPTFLIGKAGQVYRDVDIKMFPIPKPELQRKETEALIKANKLDRESLPEGLPLRRGRVGEGVPSKLKPEISSK